VSIKPGEVHILLVRLAADPCTSYAAFALKPTQAAQMSIRSYAVVSAVTALLACSEPSDTASPGPSDFISFHWPAQQPQPDARTCILLATGEEIALEPEKIIGTEHFMRAYVSDSDDFVTVQLTKTGQTILAAATRGRAGNRLAIVVNDTVVAMPTLSGELNVSDIPLMPQPSVMAAEHFAASLNEAIAAQQAPGASPY
jgi:preprotein translocase subunit SecD